MKTLAFVILILIVIITSKRQYHTPLSKLYLVSDANGNECLVMSGTFGNTRECLFMVDTAYAGAPVLSTSYLSISEKCKHGRNVAEQYLLAMELLKRPQTNDQRHVALRQLLEEGYCRSYTSGCTQRLMGIGVTNESQSDMLLCPSIVWDHRPQQTAVNADILMTHPMKGGIHILTSDYLLHRAPCILMPRAQIVQFHASNSNGFEMHKGEMLGGAFVVGLRVGTQTTIRVIVDTGAAAALSLAPSGLKKVKESLSSKAKKAFQTGVNGERVCSEVYNASIQLGSWHLESVEVFANTHEVHGCDGYMGIALLRCFDIWIQPNKIGFRLNGLAPRESLLTTAGTCTNTK